MHNLGQFILDKINKLSKIGFRWNVLRLIIRNFIAELSKFIF